MSYGWIKLHRRLKEKSWYKKSDCVHLLTHILLSASHKESSVYYNGASIDIGAGDLVTGRKKLSSETGITESRITRILNLFEREEILTQKGTNKYRVITVLNWSKYQQNEPEKSEQQTNSKTSQKRTANEQQTNSQKTSNNGTPSEILNSKENLKRTANEQQKKEKANTIQEVQEVKEDKNKRNLEEEALKYLEAAEKMKEFLSVNAGAKEALINAARFRGSAEDFEDQLQRFFAYYSENSYFISDSIKNPYKYVGKLQKWLSNSKDFKPKTNKTNEKQNRISESFREKIDRALDDW